MTKAMSPLPEEAGGLSGLDLCGAAAQLDSGAVTPLELTTAILAQITELDGWLKSYTTVTADHALDMAARATAERARGIRRGPLHGVPIAVKDLCRTSFAPTSAGMWINRDHASSRSATVVERLEQAGAVIVGKLTMTEGAFSGHHPKMKTPLNPWAPKVWTGASSSGSGVATAAGLAFGTLGSDTGGSIRFPSAACGITGLKPTWGRVSRAGVFALADSLDHIGPMARSAWDCAAMLAAIAGADQRDPTTLVAPVPDYVSGLSAGAGGLRGCRIGLDAKAVLEQSHPETAAVIGQVIEVLQSLGARIIPVTLPDDTGLLDAWTALCGVEVVLAHQGVWPEQAADYGPQLTGILETGRNTSAVALGRAIQRRLVYNGATAAMMQDVDMMLLPVTAGPIPDLAAFAAVTSGDPAAGSLDDLLRFTAPADMTGYPALTLPGGFDSRGVPVGFQLVGPALSEPALLAAGHAFQCVTDWHTRRPDLSPFIA